MKASSKVLETPLFAQLNGVTFTRFAISIIFSLLMQLSALKIHVYVSPVSQNKATKIKDSKKLETSKIDCGTKF